MLSQAVGGLLPAAAAVALSPIPIVAVVLVLHSPGARAKGPAFALGWVAGLALVSTVVVIVAAGAGDPGSDAATGVDWVLVGIGVLFLGMAGGQWRKRPRDGAEPKMPGWMATIESLSWPKTLVLGAALSGANPKNLALTLAASASIAQAGLGPTDTAIAVAAFVGIGSVSVVGAVGCYLAAPRRVERPLAAIKQFMAANNTTIMMVVLLLLGAKFLGDGLSGLWS